MESSKTGRWFNPFKKLSSLRVKDPAESNEVFRHWEYMYFEFSQLIMTYKQTFTVKL